jgi:phenylalanyl-tRNA synthetase beta chain
LNKPLKEPDRTFYEEGGPVGELLSVTVRDPELCPRYMARVVKDVRIAPSPNWMQKELQACGVRPINNIVDITNYVMLEMGQPMHAFDLRQVEGAQIIVRRATEGEKIVTLDEKERTLDTSMLVIADANKPSAVAGVMGGEHSGVQEDTSTVVFESAIFHWSSIRLTAKALGMRSESSARFEKGLPLYLAEQAMERAMALIRQLGCGKPVKGCIDILNGKMDPVRIKVSAARVNGHLGQNIPVETMKELLTHLGFSVEIRGEELNIVVPSWRKDVEAYADIAEEVQRMYGYHTIPSIPPPAEAARGGRPYNQQQALALKEVLKGLGLYEAVHYSFMAPSDLDKLRLSREDTLRNTVRILNPLGEDYSLMRTTLLPAMLRSLGMNLNRKAQKVRLFEISRVFLPVAEAPLPDEQEQLCIGIVEEGLDFFAIKGMLDTICAQMRLDKGVYEREANPSWHPGRSARLMLEGKLLAVVGEIHPDVAETYGISRRVYAIQLNVSYMIEKVSHDFSIRPLPKYPAITRDISMVLDRHVPAGDVLEAIVRAGGELLESAELFDVYEGEQVGKEKKSMAYSLVFRAQDRTLVDEEASSCFARITRALERKLGAQLRQ